MKIHFMGASGSGIKSALSLAQKLGHEVSGCDIKDGGHDVSHLENIDLLVVSPAILFQKQLHPEVLEAEKRGVLMTWEELTGQVLLKDKKIIAVSGTHGKSTTTAMVGKLLEDNGLDPIVVIGAFVPQWGGSGRFGKGGYAVVEADEFNDNFLYYDPEIIILNNVEFDHPDYFKDDDQLFDSFGKFVKTIKGEKTLIINSSDSGIKRLIENINLDGINLVKYSKDDLGRDNLQLKVVGEHNKLNASAVMCLGTHLNIPTEKIYHSINNFTGIGRRMEFIGNSKSGLEIYDDYAHHPTAIKTTLSGFRQKLNGKKIAAIIEPHGYKRTKVLLDLYKGAFESVDTVLVGPIFKARDVVDKSITPEDVAKTSGHNNAYSFDTADLLLDNAKSLLKNFSAVVVMGAGESDKWAKALLEL